MRKKIRTPRSANPPIIPPTIPAIAPRLRPFEELFCSGCEGDGPVVVVDGFAVPEVEGEDVVTAAIGTNAGGAVYTLTTSKTEIRARDSLEQE